MQMVKKYLNLANTLKQLLFHRDMKPVDLSRELNIPPPTIHRLVAGKTTRPYKSSLEPIADYFSISVEQLIGEEPLPVDPVTQTSTTLTASNIHYLSLIPWHKLQDSNNKEDYEKIPFIGAIGPKAFATIMPDSSMDPLFAKGSMLIFDDAKKPKDRSFVLAHLSEGSINVFRQLIIDAEYNYLKSLNSDLKNHQIRILKNSDKIMGTLVESRTCFENNSYGKGE